MLLWQWQRLKPRCVHPQPAYTLPSLTAQLWMSLYKIILKFFLNSRVLFLFPSKLSSALTLPPVFQNGTTTLYLTLKQHKGKGGEWRKERKKRKGKLWENFFFFLFLSLYQLSIKILPQWNSTYASFFISLHFAAMSFHCNTIKYVFFGGEKLTEMFITYPHYVSFLSVMKRVNCLKTVDVLVFQKGGWGWGWGRTQYLVAVSSILERYKWINSSCDQFEWNTLHSRLNLLVQSYYISF